MKDFWRRAKPFIWCALCVISALYFGPLSVPVGYALATRAPIPLLTTLFKPGLTFMVVMFGILVSFVVICIAVDATNKTRQKRAALPPRFYFAALFCVLYLVGWIFPLKFRHVWPQRRAGLQQTAMRAQPLIAAIEKFERKNKRAPQKLRELVPDYLSDIPQTGMAAYPRFEYSTHNEHTHFRTYQLQIRTPAGWLNWDTFNYWPEADYPAQMYGGRVERIGAWAYVHE